MTSPALPESFQHNPEHVITLFCVETIRSGGDYLTLLQDAEEVLWTAMQEDISFPAADDSHGQLTRWRTKTKHRVVSMQISL